MIINYAEKPNTIMLCIQASNNDVVTSEALKIAKSVDPDTKRTVGVMTKVDIAE